MQIKLMETGDSGNNPSLKPPSGGFKVGASPNPDYDSEPDYTDAAYTLLKSVITEVNPAANAADIASNVLSAAQSAPSETYNNTETYTWKYGSGSTQEKANAFCFWEISDPKSDTAECNVTLRAYDGTNYNTWAQLTTDIIVHSGDDNSGEIPEPSPWPTQETLTSDQATKEPPVPDDHVIEKSHTEAHRSKGMESPTTVSAEELPERNSLEQGQSDREITIMRFPVESRVRAYAGYVE